MSKLRKAIMAATPGGSLALIRRLIASFWSGSLLPLLIAAVLASAASTAAAQCPAGSPTPYGLIGDTWRRPDVQSAIGCPKEPEHDVPGRRGRLQAFANGQIAWTPDQGPKMTIWVIRNKGRFHVQWNSNDPGWSYDKYLIRWDRDGKNLGQRDISGTRGGSSNFDFTDPGSYTFIVEGRSGGGYHHGWTIPVGGVVQPGDFFQDAAPLIAAQCPAGTPVPYGLIGNTWVLNAVYWKLGCPKEPEHDVPGRRGRLQTFANGQIAWTPDQGPKMTIWAIRNKAHFRVQWDTNDPTWSYDKYLIRWDRDGKNMGQRDISGTRNGWWDFDFTDPGAYTFIVEGRSGGGYHHGWTIPVGGVVQPSDIPPPTRVVPTPGPPVAANPRITVTYDAGKTLFTVNGSGFTPNHVVHIRVVNNANIQNPVTFQATSDGSGQLVNMPIQFPISKPQTFSFSANDERQVPPSVDITGTLWSNTVTLSAT